ncbi:MAG: SCO family protein [Pelagibacteraceae bacterium]|nr:SCO family protein [Pelagibacteraceae bacterium]|tara:strand:- start:2507 stop:3106 length:600 start_codon:yes stop_codon:yes gene_type:complete
MFLKTKYLFLTAALAIFLLFFYKSKDDNSNTQIGGSYELTNHLGQKITNKSFNGYFRLVFFGFTNCPDFCPNTLNDIGLIVDKIDKKDRLVPIFITVDPERDTVKKLEKYVKNFHPKIIALTGSSDEIKNVKKTFKIFSKKIIPAENNHKDHHHKHSHGDYAVDHTTIIYLMDKKGKYLTHFSPDTNNDKIIKKINKFL